MGFSARYGHREHSNGATPRLQVAAHIDRPRPCPGSCSGAEDGAGVGQIERQRGVLTGQSFISAMLPSSRSMMLPGQIPM
jgi:hypothetical protein